MIEVRKSSDRGHFDFGWLDTYHTFSFGDYHDPKFMGFRSLRVINEDIVQPGQGFGTHPHRDMEILTYLVEGALAHKDSMGNGSTIRAGEIQYMSAGSGVQHSEFNDSSQDRAHLLQIWVLPNAQGLPPRYDQKAIPPESKHNRLGLIASENGAEGSIAIRQDARLYASVLDGREPLQVSIAAGRYVWIQVIRGALDVNGTLLDRGDGAAIRNEPSLTLRATTESEVLLFDLR